MLIICAKCWGKKGSRSGERELGDKRDLSRDEWEANVRMQTSKNAVS